jgi:hypothetical protein
MREYLVVSEWLLDCVRPPRTARLTKRATQALDIFSVDIMDRGNLARDILPGPGDLSSSVG